MKSFIKMLVLVTVSILMSPHNSIFAQVANAKLEFMQSASMDRVFEIAEKEKKPVILYINSQSCFTSKKFSREIINQSKVKSLLKKKYVSMNADIASKDGEKVAKKHGVLMTPSVFLYSYDKTLKYSLKLEFDTGVILQQLKLFTNACSMVEQVLMQKRGGDKTETEILEELGKSYASRDFKKNIETQIEHKLESYTFHLPYFDAFEAAYKAEVKNLESKKK